MIVNLNVIKEIYYYMKRRFLLSDKINKNYLKVKNVCHYLWRTHGDTFEPTLFYNSNSNLVFTEWKYSKNELSERVKTCFQKYCSSFFYRIFRRSYFFLFLGYSTVFPKIENFISNVIFNILELKKIYAFYNLNLINQCQVFV